MPRLKLLEDIGNNLVSVSNGLSRYLCPPGCREAGGTPAVPVTMGVVTKLVSVSSGLSRYLCPPGCREAGGTPAVPVGGNPGEEGHSCPV